MADQLDEQLKETLKEAPAPPALKDVGNYSLLRTLGQGGMGAVYEAEHKLLHKRFALKILSPDRIPDRNVVERFRAEAQAISALDHPNLLRIYEFGISDLGQPFLVTDLFAGVPLSEFIKSKGTLDTASSAEIIRQCTDALQHAHERGVIHRDIKTSNILVREHNGSLEVKIIDFGIAKQHQQAADGTAPPTLTATGELVGTPQYMSPEQCQGHKLDARSDIYSLGCVLYEMLTGTAPFNGSNFMTIMFQHLSEAPKPITSGDQARKSLGAVALRALAKERENRYQSMAELSDALTAVAGGAKIRAHKFKTKNGSFKDRLKIYVPMALLGIVCALAAASYELWAPSVVLYMNLPAPIKNLIMDPDQAAQMQASNQADHLRNESLRKDGTFDLDKLALAEALLKPHAVGTKPWNMHAANQLAAILALEGKHAELRSIIETVSGGVPVNIAQNLHSTATALDHGGFHKQAWPLMNESHEMFKKLCGDTDPRTVKELYNMGAADLQAGNKERALSEFKQVLPLLRYWKPELADQVRQVISELER